MGWVKSCVGDLSRDLGDLQFGKLTAMTDGAVIPLATLELESDNLVILVLIDNLGLDTGSGNEGGAKGYLVAVHNEENVAEGGLFAGFDSELLDTQNVSLGDAVLFAAGLDDCVGHGKIFGKGVRGCHGRVRETTTFFFFSLLPESHLYV